MAMENKEYFLNRLEDIREIPTLPEIAIQLVALVSDEKSSMNDISKIISEDPPLVAKILRMVNSGYYSVRNEITNIRQALVMIGIEELRNLVFAMSVFSTFKEIEGTNYFSFIQFWRHSAATGRMASVISKYLGFPLEGSAFLGGILHDFGRLILQLYFNEDYKAVFDYCQKNTVSLYQGETETLGFTHAQAGYWLAEKWKLPNEISRIMRDHHSLAPEKIDDNELVAIVYLADKVANIWGISIEPVPVMAAIENDSIWKGMSEKFPKLQDFPVEKMTKVFDMHLEEAEKFVEKISKQYELTGDEAQ